MNSTRFFLFRATIPTQFVGTFFVEFVCTRRNTGEALVGAISRRFTSNLSAMRGVFFALVTQRDAALTTKEHGAALVGNPLAARRGTGGHHTLSRSPRPGSAFHLAVVGPWPACLFHSRAFGRGGQRADHQIGAGSGQAAVVAAQSHVRFRQQRARRQMQCLLGWGWRHAHHEVLVGVHRVERAV